MDNELNGGVVYDRLAGGQKKPVGHIIGYVVIGFFIFNIFTSIAFMLLGNSTIGTILSAVIGGAALAVYIPFARKWAKLAQRQIDKRREYLERLSPSEFNALDTELESTEFMYNTFYFLEDYLYVPSARLLIPYLEIKNIQPVIHSTNGSKDGAYIKLTDQEDLLYKFNIKRWRDYVNDPNRLSNAFNAKLRKKLEEQ